jgi:hypothetical protein
LLGVTYLDDAVLPDVVLVRFESHLVLVVVIVVVIAVRPDANDAACRRGRGLFGEADVALF